MGAFHQVPSSGFRSGVPVHGIPSRSPLRWVPSRESIPGGILQDVPLRSSPGGPFHGSHSVVPPNGCAFRGSHAGSLFYWFPARYPLQGLPSVWPHPWGPIQVSRPGVRLQGSTSTGSPPEIPLGSHPWGPIQGVPSTGQFQGVPYSWSLPRGAQQGVPTTGTPRGVRTRSSIPGGPLHWS
jgi:hypothetical protein